MPLAPLPAELTKFLERPNPAVVASIKPNGELHTAATWYEVGDDHTILLNMDGSRARLKYLRHDPRVALTVVDADDWYAHLSVTGTVREIRPDPGLDDIDRLSLRYTGRPYGDRGRDSWSAIVEITRWHGWKAGAAIPR
ncbi:MAG: TIGR03618 family F420-dependent PPOX class oxidoreductase [Mycetocola sp.]